VSFVKHGHVELRHHGVRIIGVFLIKFRLIIVDPLVSLVEEVVEPITNGGFRSSEGFRDVVALAVVVMLEGLPLTFARYIKPSGFLVHLGSLLNNQFLFRGQT
jgi:hypothetical protein